MAIIATAVRVFDHVDEVRTQARSVVLERVDATSAAAILPILITGRRRWQADVFMVDYTARLTSDVIHQLIHANQATVRAFAIDHAEFDVDELIVIALGDPDTRCRHLATLRALATGPEVATTLLNRGGAHARAAVVTQLSEEAIQPFIERVLLDRSALVRSRAQDRAAAAGVVAIDVYRANLPARAAVAGLGEVGDETDVSRLLPFVETPENRRAATRSLARIAPREVLAERLPPLLQDDQPGVVREAATGLIRAGLQLSHEQFVGAVSSPQLWSRRAALRVSSRRASWNGLIAALTLNDDTDSDLRTEARAALAQWLLTKAPSAGTPTDSQRQTIAHLLATVRLASATDRAVRFHAGIG